MVIFDPILTVFWLVLSIKSIKMTLCTPKTLSGGWFTRSIAPFLALNHLRLLVLYRAPILGQYPDLTANPIFDWFKAYFDKDLCFKTSYDTSTRTWVHCIAHLTNRTTNMYFAQWHAFPSFWWQVPKTLKKPQNFRKFTDFPRAKFK